VGVDLSLVGNRITITADYFSKRYSDMITDRLIPIYAGIVSDAYYENRIAQPVNSATVLNKGFEFAINYRKAQGVLTYDLGLNLTTYTNKVIKLDDAIIGGATGKHSTGEFNTDFERQVGWRILRLANRRDISDATGGGQCQRIRRSYRSISECRYGSWRYPVQRS